MSETTAEGLEYIHLWTENQRLKQRVAELEEKLAAYEPGALYAENQKLRIRITEMTAEHERAMMLAAQFVPDNRGRQ